MSAVKLDRTRSMHFDIMGFQLKLPKAVIMIGMVPKISSLSFSKTKLLSDRARADPSAPGASSCLTWNFPVIP